MRVHARQKPAHLVLEVARADAEERMVLPDLERRAPQPRARPQATVEICGVAEEAMRRREPRRRRYAA